MVGVKYRIPDDYEWEGISPFRGLFCTVLDAGGVTQAGFDCFVKLHVTPEELAARYSVAHGKTVTVNDVIDWHGEQNFHTDGFKYEPGLYIEHEATHLEPLEHPQLKGLALTLTYALIATDEALHKWNKAYHDADSLATYAKDKEVAKRARKAAKRMMQAANEIGDLRRRVSNIAVDSRVFDTDWEL
jgi:hypothetical protein